MNRRSSFWLNLGEWILKHRWRLVALASFVVIFFEDGEYMPQTKGINSHFLFEALFYGIFLPISTGLALSGLAASRSELAWFSYYQNLKNNLVIQMNRASSPSMLASVVLRFFQAVMPLAGATLNIYDEETQKYQTLLDWSPKEENSHAGSISECTAQGCPCLNFERGEDRAIPQACRDSRVIGTSRTSSSFCIPFTFPDSPVIAARLYFTRGSQPSPEQVRLLKQVAPEIASAFQRIELEHWMKKRYDSLNAEQQRIARDVHDSLGHSLAYLRLRLDQISMELNWHEMNSLHQEVEALRDVAKEAYDQMRGALIALTENNDAQLTNKLMNYSDKISQRADFKAEIQQHGKPRVLLPLVQRNIFYIFQEALANIEKHAHAHQVDIELHWEEKELAIDVTDDGVGYDPTLPIPNGHFGLSNMRERALESHGELLISSQPGEGTHLALCIPYEDNHEINHR